jgi:hypothetical protein
MSCGICGGQSATVAGFLRVLRVPLPIFITPTATHSSSIIWDCYNWSISGRILISAQKEVDEME